MTKKWETYTKTVEQRRCVSVTCDLCGEEICERRHIYSVRDFELEFTEGDCYPDGGFKEGWRVEDLCNQCVGKLKELLVVNGFKISKVAVDW